MTLGSAFRQEALRDDPASDQADAQGTVRKRWSRKPAPSRHAQPVTTLRRPVRRLPARFHFTLGTLSDTPAPRRATPKATQAAQFGLISQKFLARPFVFPARGRRYEG